jgi:hypothetical protein
MSQLSECVTLYRDDIEVEDELFVRFILDAHARDLEAAARDDLNGGPYGGTRIVSPGQAAAAWAANKPNEQDADLAFPSIHADQLRDATANVDLAELMTPEQCARYLLAQLGTIGETLDLLGVAIDGLNQLDTMRTKRLDRLDDAISYCERRHDLRAEECQALNNRIESVTRAIAAGNRPGTV